MKKISVLLLVGHFCSFAPIYADESDGDEAADRQYNEMIQRAQGDDNQYDERRREYRGNEQRPLIRRDDEGDNYVIPWNESQEYYGNPPPQVLDEPPQDQGR